MNYLIVVAHPDDEVLGAGATINSLCKAGHIVDVCIMSGEARARANRPSDDDLATDINDSCNLLGVRKVYHGDFPNIQMNMVPHLHLVQFIEAAILQSEADVLITHHMSDTNNDHLQTFLAAQAAFRLFQRRDDVKPIQEMWLMEVLSSTEWSFSPAADKFNPNLFVTVGKQGIEAKLKALATYRGVMREYPHPRSKETIEGLAAYRGSQGGCEYAEAFECVFRRM